MPKTVHLIDNHTDGTSIEKDCISDILKIASIGRLQNVPDLLVFPHSFSELKDGISDLSILTLRDTQYERAECVSVKACTGNLMGFVGVNDTSVSIHSRFTHKKHDGIVDENAQDYFLYYLLQKVFSINIFDLDHTNSREDKVFDFLLFLFPMMLKKALSQGLFKEYQTRCHDDAKVKGVIDINRFIRHDIPFKGAVSYSTHERSFDNSITQLIRHTIEYIKHHPFGSAILNKDNEIIEYVNQVVQATPTYSQRDRMRILNANRRPKVHPYFTKYRDLQLLCVHILRHDALKYGKEKNKIHGVLFDGAWLWEEYLYTILKSEGFEHPRNKEKQGGINMFVDSSGDMVFDKNNRELFPDFYKEDFVLDAKYKHLNSTVGRDDLYQVVTYMYCLDYRFGGYIYPKDGNQQHAKFKLAGIGCNYEGNEGGIISVIPFNVPQNAPNWGKFVEYISNSEKQLVKDIYAGLHF